MKKVTLFFLTIGLVTLNGCNQKTDVNAVLENSETKTEIFDAIANNHSYMMQFMQNMQASDHAMQMMKGDNQMMGKMMQGGMQMMMKDSMMMMNMMQSMMKDGKMMGNMMRMMHEKGMMSDECMESCKNMMAEKGMDIIEQGELELSKSQSHGDHH
ncbi:hypothetical protein [Maribacter polysaccharolyticus]|uniref:hypothetical protein n=1 Tax=Maribacter polysaccharolyticus TaxID=3020831 RepID=UPI00237EF84D|nr:hypothetical protein [Maribacter polysaccharolyticus]MDE3741086.1 hypothetical protein [Maribacter polysaccharolyticus]